MKVKIDTEEEVVTIENGGPVTVGELMKVLDKVPESYRVAFERCSVKWDEWWDKFPVVPDFPDKYNGDNICPKCGIKLEGVMGYYCPRTDCPTGLGGLTFCVNS